MTTYQQHPLSAAFPPMADDEYLALLDSITNIGVQNPITIYEGMVLDGWNRYRAATEVGYECPTEPLGDVDPRDFVMAQNSARRSLTASQRALAAAACYQWKPVGNPLFRSTSELASQTAVAAAAKVSDTTLRQARTVLDHAVDEVKEAVRAGSIPVEAAAQVAKLPKDQQVDALRAPKPARFKDKPKKGAKADVIRAELKAADNKASADAAKGRVTELEEMVVELGHQLEDALRQSAATQADNESVAKILNAGDQLAAAIAEAKKYRDLAQGLQERINSMTTQIAELKRSVASWKKKAEAVT
ncbi:MAG: hypothetical protein JSS56_04775 [Proteobacteria bacterium]|nr:hypothetical protein [Pseudomonadota bacterium]